MYAFVLESVRRGLVPALDDLGNEIRIAAGRDTEQEEGRLCADLVQQLQDRLRLPFQGGPARVPIRDPESAVNELVPVLEVEAEQQRRFHPATLATAAYAAPVFASPSSLPSGAGTTEGTTRDLPASLAR